MDERTLRQRIREGLAVDGVGVDVIVRQEGSTWIAQATRTSGPAQHHSVAEAPDKIAALRLLVKKLLEVTSSDDSDKPQHERLERLEAELNDEPPP
jgi:hypothetical protein